LTAPAIENVNCPAFHKGAPRPGETTGLTVAGQRRFNSP
jgi:hypothetical protein